MIQPKTDTSVPKSHAEPARLRDPRLMRQMQFQNNQRNRGVPPGPAQQRFGHLSPAFPSNSQLDHPTVNRPPFSAPLVDDSSRKSRTASKNRSSSKDVKSRSTSKTSPKSQKSSSSSQKSSKSSNLSSPKSSSKSSKTSSPSSRSSPKDPKRDRYKDKELSKVSPSQSLAMTNLAEAERKIKEFTIPKKRSPSPKDKLIKSITDPKVSSTTKTADSPTKFKGNKTNSKSRNYVKQNKDGSVSPTSNKDSVDVVQQKTPPATATATAAAETTTTSESIGSSIASSTNEPLQTNIGSEPITGAGENQDFKSKDTKFVVRMVKISHIVHNLLTRLMISDGLIIDCINRRDDILNKLIVIGTGDNFFY